MKAYKAELQDVTLEIFRHWFEYEWTTIWSNGAPITIDEIVPLTYLETIDSEGLADTVVPDTLVDTDPPSLVLLAQQPTQNKYYSRWTMTKFGSDVQKEVQCIFAVTQHRMSSVKVWLLDMTEKDTISEPLRSWIEQTFNAEVQHGFGLDQFATQVERESRTAKQGIEEKEPRDGVCERVQEFHRLMKNGYSLNQASKESGTAVTTYKTWCLRCTQEEHISPYR